MRDVVAAVSHRLPLPRRRSIGEVRPLSLAGTSTGAALAAMCGAAIVSVTALEAVKPDLASLGAILFIPVLAAAWLLGSLEALIVSGLAVTARLIGYAVAGVDLPTALAEVCTLAALAITTRLAAQGVVDSRVRAERMARDRETLDLAEQRERIAQSVTDIAIRRLYGLTVRLQAIAVLVEREKLRAALHDVIDEADALARDFRGLIFQRNGDAAASASPAPASNPDAMERADRRTTG